MKTTYFIKNNQLVETSNNEQAEVSIYKNISTGEKQRFLEEYNLPKDVFYFDNIIPVAPRFEQISNSKLGESLILVISNITPTNEFVSIEGRLESHIFIKSKQQLFWFINNNKSRFDSEVLSDENYSFHSIEHILMYAILHAYSNYAEELSYQKQQIDYLNNQSNKTTSNNLLALVAETEQNLVLLEHTINSQEHAIRNLLKNEMFTLSLDNPLLVHDVQWYNNLVKKLVHVYRDLFDAVSSLYSDLINNNLNQLMRYLSSLSIIIATSALVAGLWGMNTGGLPFKDHPIGTFIMIIITLIAGLFMYFFLKQKNFFDD